MINGIKYLKNFHPKMVMKKNWRKNINIKFSKNSNSMLR